MCNSVYKIKKIFLYLLFSSTPINPENIKNNPASAVICWSDLFLHTSYFFFKYLPYLFVIKVFVTIGGNAYISLSDPNDAINFNEELPKLILLLTTLSIFFIKYWILKKMGGKLARFRFLSITIFLLLIGSNFIWYGGDSFIEGLTFLTILIGLTCALPYEISKKIKEKINETGLYLLFKQWDIKLLSIKNLSNNLKQSTNFLELPSAINNYGSLITNKLFLSGAISIFLLILWLYSGTPTGISDTDYNDYKQLSAPKILYSCSKLADITYKNLEEKLKCIREGNTDEECRLEKIVTYKAGVGFAATYNKLLGEAKDECKGENATFKIIESEK